MRGRPRFAVSGAGIGLLAAAAALLSVVGQAPPASSLVSGSGESGTRPPTADTRFSFGADAASAFTISGGVAGLYPGDTVPLVLTVSNNRTFAVTVTDITTFIGVPTAPCSGSYLKVTGFHGALLVPGGHHATAAVIATLSHSAPNGCQGAVFPLHYLGLGHR